MLIFVCLLASVANGIPDPEKYFLGAKRENIRLLYVRVAYFIIIRTSSPITATFKGRPAHLAIS